MNIKYCGIFIGLLLNFCVCGFFEIGPKTPVDFPTLEIPDEKGNLLSYIITTKKKVISGMPRYSEEQMSLVGKHIDDIYSKALEFKLGNSIEAQALERFHTEFKQTMIEVRNNRNWLAKLSNIAPIAFLLVSIPPIVIGILQFSGGKEAQEKSQEIQQSVAQAENNYQGNATAAMNQPQGSGSDSTQATLSPITIH